MEEVKMKREAFGLVTLNDKEELEFKILHKTITDGYPYPTFQNLDFLYDEEEAQNIARKIAKNLKKVIVVQISAVYEMELNDKLDEI